MKKLFILAAAVITLASCGNKTNGNNDATDSAAVATDSVNAAQYTGGKSADETVQALNEQLNAKDTKNLEATLAEAKTQYEALVKAGKTEEAAQYASKLKEFYDKNAETIKTVATGNTTINNLVNGIANLPTDADNAAQALKSAAESDANATVNGVKDAANKATENAKQTVKDAENSARQAVKNAESNARQSVSNAKKNAEDKAKSAVSNAKQKTRDAANKAVNDALNKAFGN